MSSWLNSNLPARVGYPAHFSLWPKVFLFAVLTLSTVDGAIDFTPVAGERNMEGIVFKQLIFRENGRKITYEQPKGWSYSGNSKGLRLTPPNLEQAQADIVQSPLPAPQPNAEAAMKEQAMMLIPAGNQQATVVAEERNSLRINGRDTYGVTINYLLYGQEYSVNVLFANLEDTQLRFRIVTRKQDFEKLFRAFRGSLFTLQWERAKVP